MCLDYVVLPTFSRQCFFFSFFFINSKFQISLHLLANKPSLADHEQKNSLIASAEGVVSRIIIYVGISISAVFSVSTVLAPCSLLNVAVRLFLCSAAAQQTEVYDVECPDLLSLPRILKLYEISK